MPRLVLVLLLMSMVTVPARAQSARSDDLLGTWKFDLKQGDKKTGPRTVVVRPDSSASYGKETVRWRVKPDSLLLALGGEWVSYRLKLKGKSMVLSGGDLTEPISFDKIGPPTPRPDSVPVPPDPDQQPS
jgi:hypothetical protein